MERMGVEPAVDTWTGTALRFSAFNPGGNTAIIGTSRSEHLAEAVEAVGRGPLPSQECQRWEAALTRHEAARPGGVQEPTAASRS